ncbi:hypothetical protein GCM10025298_15080 [Natronobiforma cellulositropha]
MEPEPLAEGVPPFLEYLVIALVLALALVLAWYLLAHRRDALKLLAIVAVFALGLLAVIYLVSTIDVTVDPPPAELPPPENETGGEPGGGGDGTADTLPVGTLLVLIGAVTAVFVGALALTRSSDDTAPAPSSTVSEDDTHAAAVGAAAGEAAARIEEAAGDDLDNEVYRAWLEMTRLLEVSHPETTTPGEFADAAVDAGLEGQHVAALTRLFEEVRYGDAETTAETERRALETLRAIEAAYAGDASVTDDTPARPGRDGGRR